MAVTNLSCMKVRVGQVSEYGGQSSLLVFLVHTAIMARSGDKATTNNLARWQLAQSSLVTLAVIHSADLLRVSISLANTLILLTNLLALTTASTHSRHITIVAVDAHQVGCHTLDLDVGDNHVSWAAVVGAITAGAVELASVDDGVVLDRDCATAVVLDDVVFGVLGTATLN